MSDPLSITAGVVAIVVPALHGTRLLLDDLEKFRDAPKVIKRLVKDVHSVDAALTLLQGVGESDWELLGASIAEQSKTTISSCTDACNMFRTDLERWTRHTADGKFAWQDRANVAFFKQSQIKTMSEQLQSYKVGINNVVSIATLYSSVRHTHITEEIKKIISTKHTEVKGAITTADKQSIVLENKLEELALSSDEDVTGPNEGKAGALRQLEEGRKALDASRKLLDELLVKSQEESVAKVSRGYHGNSTTMTFGNAYSSIQAGTINGPATVGRI